jgi:predicted transcriptional regulator
VKLSISLSEEDVALLDEYARRVGLPSRSAAVQRAVRLLRYPDLEGEYAAAWEEWEADGQEAGWAAATGDGVVRAAR